MWWYVTTFWKQYALARFLGDSPVASLRHARLWTRGIDETRRERVTQLSKTVNAAHGDALARLDDDGNIDGAGSSRDV